MPPEIDENDVQNNEPESRRDALMAGLEAAEAAANPAAQADAASQDLADGRARDDHGRFAPKTDQQAAAAAPLQNDPAAAPEAAPIVEAPRLTTWKRDMLPLHDKLATGQPLTAEEAQRLAAYNVQREKEYSTGVSTYKAEAMQAREITGAIAEFMPTLQQHGLQPATWIQNLGRAHHTLALGSPEQKLNMFTQLAHEYGVPLGLVQQAQQGQVDPLAMQLMSQMQQMQGNVQAISAWRQAQEDQAVQQEISKFTDATQYPHFDQVRPMMAQLLESGLAQNPDEAYAKAVRLDESIAVQEPQRQAALPQPPATVQSRAAAVSKARGAAVSVRTATPSGAAKQPAPTDRRAGLEAAFESLDTGRV